MSKKQLDLLLQECLAAYDSGRSPNECLAAFPEHREELEPLFRQALSLRVAFAASPSETFRAEARNRLLVAAGRDVIQAYSRKPDPDFVLRTRERFLEAAGASTQEALRAIPPPRLPFWVNTRRRLLETAAKPAPQPVARPVALNLRRGLSGAAIALAIAAGGIGYMATQSNPSVNADLASLEQDLMQVEAQAQAGQVVPASVIIDLSRRTNELVEKLNDQPAQVPSAEKLPAIIERQQAVATQAVVEGPPPPELRQAQQNLAQAEEKVVRLFAAAAATPTSQPAAIQATATTPPAATATSQPAALAPTAVPTTVPPTATAIPTTAPPATPGPLQPGQVSVALLPGDNFASMSWTEIRTTTIRFVAPSDWTIVGLNVDSSGIATLGGDNLRVQNQAVNVLVNLNVKNGETVAIVDGQQIRLRSRGADGDPISAIDAISKTGPETGATLYHLTESIELAEPEPTPTPTATATPVPPTSTPTATPVPPTATPVPPTATPAP